jgi:D-cysteine desulfhydrase
MLRLSEALGGKVNLWVKRDDLLRGAAGGNKTRKLDFSIGEAIYQKADTLITCGGIQSNHCRLTLAWANNEGLDCHLVLRKKDANADYPPETGGNNFLFHLLGAAANNIHEIENAGNMSQKMEDVADTLKKKGRKPYIIPMGASNAVGALGYVFFAEELKRQIIEARLRIDHLVIPSGSGGTHAGIVAGLFGGNARIPVTGINVLSNPRKFQEKLVHDLVLELAKMLPIPTVPHELVVCNDSYIGSGYCIPTDEMKEAVKLFAKYEGILLDPVYSGKAAAGLIDFVRQGKFAAGSNVIFLHTGGAPSLYPYQDIFM